MRVARVSVVDGAGKEVFDQLVRMDEGVEIVYVICLSFHSTFTLTRRTAIISLNSRVSQKQLTIDRFCRCRKYDGHSTHCSVKRQSSLAMRLIMTVSRHQGNT